MSSEERYHVQLKTTAEKTPTPSEVRITILAATAAVPSSYGLGTMQEDFYCSGNMHWLLWSKFCANGSHMV